MSYFVRFGLLSLVFIFISCSSSSSNQYKTEQKDDLTKSFDKITSTKPIKPIDYQKMLRVGMDVDWAKTDQARGYYQDAHSSGINVAKKFKDRGFSHVRIRVAEDVLSDSSLLDELKIIVDDCFEAKLIPIIAYQAKPFKLNPTDEKTMDGVKKWWEKVASTFKEYPYTLAYDLVIETTDEVKKNNDTLNLLYENVTKAIRDIDEKRVIIVAPNNISNPENLDPEAKNPLIVPKPYDYMMVEWHFYAAGPQRDNPRKQWTTGTESEKKLITDKINYALDFTKRTSIPTWVGAWMVTDYNRVDKEKTYPDGAPAGGEYTLDEQKEFASFMSKSLNPNYAIEIEI